MFAFESHEQTWFDLPLLCHDIKNVFGQNGCCLDFLFFLVMVRCLYFGPSSSFLFLLFLLFLYTYLSQLGGAKTRLLCFHVKAIHRCFVYFNLAQVWSKFLVWMCLSLILAGFKPQMIGHSRAAGFGRMSEEVIANFGGKKQMFNLVFSVILEIIRRQDSLRTNQ